jgi:alpha-D-ribose 1-methylphosphonate 5-triphosphate synthase subunit PhnI
MSTLDPSDEQEERQPNEPQLNVNNQFPLEKEAPVKKKGEKKRPVEFIREPGKSLLPISRVQKIIKADKAFLLCLSSVTLIDHRSTGNTHYREGCDLFDIHSNGGIHQTP